MTGYKRVESLPPPAKGTENKKNTLDGKKNGKKKLITKITGTPWFSNSVPVRTVPEGCCREHAQQHCPPKRKNKRRRNRQTSIV